MTHPQHHESAPAEPLRIMPMGDSITRGLHNAGAVPGGYRARLHRRLNGELFSASGVRFVGTRDDNPHPDLPDPQHEGRGGFRIDEHFPTIREAVATCRPAVVLLHLGTNDIGQDYELPAAPDRLERLIDLIQAGSPETWVLVAKIIDSRITESSAKVRTYNNALATRVSVRRGGGERVALADLFEAVGKDNYHDGYHPDATGYDALADAWFDALAALDVAAGGLCNPAPHREKVGLPVAGA